jgi:hypothetical protein
MTGLPGTSIALPRSAGDTMKNLARVSAVFLLILVLGICGEVSGADVDRRGGSSQRPRSYEVGVGTKSGALGKEASGDVEESPGVKVKPLVVFRAIEAGWRSGTPKPFGSYLGKGKVRLDFVEGGSRGGLFTRGQAYYLIVDYLRRTQTTEIGFLKISDGSDGQSRPYAMLERICRTKNGISRKEVIFVSLSLEDNAWVISELRAIPAK